MKNIRNLVLLVVSFAVLTYACVAGGLKPKDVCVDFADRDAGDTGEAGDYARHQ